MTFKVHKVRLYVHTSWENLKIGFILVHNAAIKALHDMKKSLMILHFFVFLFLLSLHISILFVFAYFIFEAHKADKWHRVIPIHDVVLFKLRFYGNFDYLFVWALSLTICMVLLIAHFVKA